jgi:hypothetical protein
MNEITDLSKSQSLRKRKLKMNFKNNIRTDKQLISIWQFDLNCIEFLIKYRTCVYEAREKNSQGQETFMIPKTPGVIELGKLDFLKGPFHNRMVFKECNPAELHCNLKFNRWIKIRNVVFFDAMLFIRKDNKLFRMSFDKGPIHLPLLNKHFYSLMNQLNSK